MNNELNNQNDNPTQPTQPVQPQVVPQPMAPVEPQVPQPVMEQQISDMPVTAPQTPVAPIAQPTPEIPVTPEQVQQPTPQPEVPVQSVVETIPEVESTPIVEETNHEDISDVSSTTFDYNDIYGAQDETATTEETAVDQETSVFKVRDIEVGNQSINVSNANDITPEFNINALDGSEVATENKLTGEVLNNKEQDKADTRRKILFILVIVLIMVVFVGFIFPLIKGYK